MDRDALLERVKQTVRGVEPDADVILYGSRSRGNSQPESDWDFVVLVDGHVDDRRTDGVRHALYEVEWDTGEVISSIVRSREDWNSPPRSPRNRLAPTTTCSNAARKLTTRTSSTSRSPKYGSGSPRPGRSSNA